MSPLMGLRLIVGTLRMFEQRVALFNKLVVGIGVNPDRR